MSRGFYMIGVVNGKNHQNLGTLWRSAHGFGAAQIFTCGKRYPKRCEPSDVTKAPRHVPLVHYADIADLVTHVPAHTELVGIEIDARASMLEPFRHPERACYLLGAEDRGLDEAARAACHRIVAIEGSPRCLNVAVAGSIVMWDRLRKSMAGMGR